MMCSTLCWVFVTLDGLRIFFDTEGPLLRPGANGDVPAQQLLCLHGGPGVDHTTLRPLSVASSIRRSNRRMSSM